MGEVLVHFKVFKSLSFTMFEEITICYGHAVLHNFPRIDETSIFVERAGWNKHDEKKNGSY